jgi:hypothetical protein
MPDTDLKSALLRFARSIVGLSQTLKALQGTHPRRARMLTLAAAIPAFGAVAAFGFAPLAPDATELPVEAVEVALPGVPIGDQVQRLDLAHDSYFRETAIGRSDTLGAVLVRLGIDDRAAENFIRHDSLSQGLGQMRSGNPVFANVDERGTLISLRFPVGQINRADPLDGGASDSIVVERDAQGLHSHHAVEANEREIEMRSGEVTSSLYGSTDAAGIPDQVASQTAEIFSGEIDFYRDLHRGDQFRVVYETFHHDGAVAHPGRVLAVEFVTAGKLHQAVWYQPHGEGGSYYGFDGRSMKRAFLRAPLQFTRITRVSIRRSMVICRHLPRAYAQASR